MKSHAPQSRVAALPGPGLPWRPKAASSGHGHQADQINLQFAGDDPADLSHRYLWNPAAVDQVLADEAVTSLSSAGDVLWPLGDHQGSLRDLAVYDAGTDATTIANHREYNAYGELTGETDDAVDHLFAYTGRERDDETGLQYHRARYYDPAVGRWLSEDPIRFAAGDTNLNRMVGNNPVSLNDPSGLSETGTGSGPLVPWMASAVGTWMIQNYVNRRLNQGFPGPGGMPAPPPVPLIPAPIGLDLNASAVVGVGVTGGVFISAPAPGRWRPTFRPYVGPGVGVNASVSATVGATPPAPDWYVYANVDAPTGPNFPCALVSGTILAGTAGPVGPIPFSPIFTPPGVGAGYGFGVASLNYVYSW